VSGSRVSAQANILAAPQPLERGLIDAASRFDAATLHEAAGKIGVLPPAIKPVVAAFKVCGTAVPVSSPGGDNLWLHRALYAARPGDVLVVHVSDQYDHGYWGEVMSTAARARGLAGLVIDGCVRDRTMLEQIGFPVFSRGLCIRGTGKDPDGVGSINTPTKFGDWVVRAGDLIVGDADGVVCIPRAQVAATLEAAAKRVAREAAECVQLADGATTTMSLYALE
jgi:4-hydroxy-4-methyl-2-oxoglutarate aldolase